MRLYFDCCCYNRPFDDQSQQRIHDESEAILSLINRVAACGDTILDSSILRLEIEHISESVKKAKVQQLHRIASEVITYAPEIRRRAEEIRQMTAIHEMDSLHLASAEFGNADVFLTTVGFARFVQQFENGWGDYTREKYERKSPTFDELDDMLRAHS